MIFNVVWTTRDLFQNWGVLPSMQQAYNVRLGELAHYIDLTADTVPTVICTPDLKPQVNPVTLNNGQLLALMMHRQDVVLRYADCGSALILTGGGSKEQVIFSDPSGIEGVNPSLRSWLGQGEIVDRPDIPPQSVVELEVADTLAQRIGSFMTTSPASFAPESPGGAQVVAPPVRFGGNITFLGYEHSWADSYHPGDVVPVITYWRVDGDVPPHLRLFTHILSDSTTIWAQSDPISVLPAQLLPRDIFIQVTYVMLPRAMPPDKYGISVGAYDDITKNRLPVFSGDQPEGSRLFVGQIDVQGQQ